MAYIYALIDPRTGEIRYVGKTERTLEDRHTEHLKDARRVVNRYVYKWIRQLLKEDVIPIIEPLEECFSGDLDSRERHWIKYGKESGWQLTNGTDGGGGKLGCIASEETRRKISVGGKGKIRSPETRKRISKSKQGNRSCVGRRYSEETKNKMRESAKGHVVTEETRKKISDTKKGTLLSSDHVNYLKNKFKGEGNPYSKLSESDVLTIRKLLKNGKRGVDIAREYGVSRSVISGIKLRRGWVHLDDSEDSE